MYRKYRGEVVLFTDYFTCPSPFVEGECEGVELLIDVLTNKFGLLVTKQKRTEDAYRIYIHKKSIGKFRYLIKPYILSTMSYKIGL